MDRELLLSAKDIEIEFTLRGKVLKAIRKCSLDVYEGETIAIVGESGSGKSVFTKSFLGMLDANGSITGGSITYGGVDISKYKTEKEWMGIRGRKISMVMQDPMTSLNPLKKIGKQIQESIEINQGIKGEEARKKAIEMMEMVGITDAERRANQYPHEFSGGMRQRVVIAIATACHPQILICDEPTTALDVTIQAQILELMAHMKNEFNTSVILITHDLGVISSLCTRVIVMYGGLIMEEGKIEDIFYRTGHPYTAGLLASIPKRTKEKLVPIFGTPPDLLNPPKGCPFAARCSRAMKLCAVHQPPFCDLGNGHVSACWLHNESVKARMGEVKL